MRWGRAEALSDEGYLFFAAELARHALEADPAQGVADGIAKILNPIGGSEV